MKFATTVVLTAAAAQLILAQPHGHAHHHKKHIQNVSVVKRDMATVYVNESGDVISLDDVCTGLAAKKLRFKDGDAPADLCDKPAPAPSTTAPSITAAPEPTSSAAGAAFYEASTTEAASSAAPSSTQEASSAPAAASSAAPSPKKGSSGGKGLDSEFPDGELDCKTFPSDYGAIPVDYLGHNGWIGIQKVSIANNFVQDIVTGISGDGCTDGSMCSYACPPGYLKSQWPSTQGATGQSVGGLECSDGKLKLTNPDLSKSLCIKGTGGVKAKNKASDVVSICRTDYPGTESETVPVVVDAGSEEELACPDSGTYYKWKGMATSAQYYLNPIGTGPEDACQWGSAGSKKGNWAPINFGVSKKG
jgi:SUN family beta-glucosidase